MPSVCRHAISCGVLVAVIGNAAIAQEYSRDGNRWYEVEVSIFTNDFLPGEHAEIAVPEKLDAAYLPRLRQLQARTASLAIDFPEDRPDSDVFAEQPLRVPGNSSLPVGQEARAQQPPEPELPEAPPLQGPVYSPALPGSFRLSDIERDPYIDLDGAFARFTAMNRNIDSSADHRLLWHKVWRQPMQGRAQAPAVFIEGGDIREEHTELEGSLRLSDSEGRVRLEINAWLIRFTLGQFDTGALWELPEKAFETEDKLDGLRPMTDLTVQPAWSIAEVWQLQQSREIGPDQLYYLDNPALGVLIQIRPYVLPVKVTTEAEEDF